jgi:hypothetical protein
MRWRQVARTLLCLSVVLEASAGGTRTTRTTAAISVAAPAMIEGEVKDRSGQPLPGASVIALPERGGLATHTATDRDGGYHLEGLSQGIYRVDVSLRGFDGSRQNHVRVGADDSIRVDAVLSVRPLCECISSRLPPAGPRSVPGQVVDEAGRPLPHARLEFVGPNRRETAYAHSEGRFLVSTPAGGTWSMVASDSGFASVMQQISTATTAPLVFRLRFVGTQGLPDIERFNRECPCYEFIAVES